ncbi:MAG TPA: DUF1501 domain-containing protein [Polyangiaceae bacterium]|jgi:hypothetical protein|nr:DUF1501 domain-containing protein [Polyangiaceae bacterium]
MDFKRRQALMTMLFGAGAVGLRALATGLPAWFIANPRKASADDLKCALDATKTQSLIVSVSSNGDPINCNCPGTYEDATAIHPQQAEVAALTLALGSKMYGAATPWSTLGDALNRACFFHHVTLSIVHGDQPKVMRLMGATSGGEMLVSAYAKHLAPCLGTVQTEPVSVGAHGNSSELISFAGRSLPSVSPTQLRQLLTGSGASGGFQGKSGQNPLVALRSMRDTELNALYDLAKSDGTNVQKDFIDALAASQTQVRELAESLSDTLSKINGDDIAGQALAAAALISAKVTPVVAVHVPFGGDNHNDSDLQAEADQTVSGVAGIKAILDALTMMNLQDSATFATLNVFGRNLNKLDKVEARTGRDHYGNHSVCVMIGKNVAPGVVGGILPVSAQGSDGALGAADIDSATGNAVPMGDIPRTETHVAMARTLGVALGISSDALSADFTSMSGGKVVNAALNGVSG